MDLNDITPGTVELDILHPATFEPIGLKLTLRSPSHPEVKALAQASVERERSLSRRGKHSTVAQQEREAVKINAACVIDLKWSGEATLDGEKPDYSPEVVHKLMQRDFILKQVAEQLREEADFFAPAGTR